MKQLVAKVTFANELQAAGFGFFSAARSILPQKSFPFLFVFLRLFRGFPFFSTYIYIYLPFFSGVLIPGKNTGSIHSGNHGSTQFLP